MYPGAAIEYFIVQQHMTRRIISAVCVNACKFLTALKRLLDTQNRSIAELLEQQLLFGFSLQLPPTQPCKEQGHGQQCHGQLD